MAFHPYLFFGGNCREAFTRYQEIFGGELVLLTMKDMPSEEPVPAEQADMIMHAALMFDDHLLMASDDPTTDSFGPVQGMQVNYTDADVAEAKRVFEALADGGKVTLPIGRDLLVAGVRHVRRPVRHALDDQRRRARARPHELRRPHERHRRRRRWCGRSSATGPEPFGKATSTVFWPTIPATSSCSTSRHPRSA